MLRMMKWTVADEIDWWQIRKLGRMHRWSMAVCSISWGD